MIFDEKTSKKRKELEKRNWFKKMGHQMLKKLKKHLVQKKNHKQRMISWKEKEVS